VAKPSHDTEGGTDRAGNGKHPARADYVLV
jgi:hypothetical protein